MDRAVNLKELREAQKTLREPKRRRKLDSVKYRHTNGIDAKDLPVKDLHLKPPFKANATERIDCPLPLVKRYNPINVTDYCHGWLFKDELCHHASYCAPYLELLIQRVCEGKHVDIGVLSKLGINTELIKRR